MIVSNVKKEQGSVHLLGGRDTFRASFDHNRERYMFAVQGGEVFYKRLTGVDSDVYGQGKETMFYAPWDYTTNEGKAAEELLKNISGYVELEPIIL